MAQLVFLLLLSMLSASVDCQSLVPQQNYPMAMKWQELKTMHFDGTATLSAGIKPLRLVTFETGFGVQDDQLFLIAASESVCCNVTGRREYDGSGQESWPPLTWNCSMSWLPPDYTVTDTQVECECFDSCLNEEVLLQSCRLRIAISATSETKWLTAFSIISNGFKKFALIFVGIAGAFIAFIFSYHCIGSLFLHCCRRRDYSRIRRCEVV